MSHASENFDPVIDRQAAEWFGRRELGLTAEHEQTFQRWLQTDPRHAEYYAQFDETWALLDELKELPRFTDTVTARGPSSRHHWIAVALAAAAAILVGFVLWSHPATEVIHYAVATDAGGMKKLELPDGSIVRLNAATSLKVELTAGFRRVNLEHGEAYFTVAKDPNRPFIVSAEGVAVRAVGTAFNVAMRPAGLEVLVTEGKVRVEDATGGEHSRLPQSTIIDAHPVLVSGRKATLARDDRNHLSSLARIDDVAPTEASRTLAWQTRWLEFDMQPLSAMVAEFNRYNEHQLEIADADLARRRFGGNFRADNSEAFVELLQDRFDVIAKHEEGKTILTLRR